MSQLEDVFGIRTKPVLSYTERSQVDGQFQDALKTDNHIVIYGSSKQGKTALRQKHIPDSECLFIHSGVKTTTEDMYCASPR